MRTPRQRHCLLLASRHLLHLEAAPSLDACYVVGEMTMPAAVILPNPKTKAPTSPPAVWRHREGSAGGADRVTIVSWDGGGQLPRPILIMYSGD